MARWSPFERAAAVALALLLSVLAASNLAGSGWDPEAVSALLALLALGILGARAARPPRTALLALLFAAAAWNAFVNARVEYRPIHFHDAGHYYLGSRYFDELGYVHLYDAVLLVLSEADPPRELPEQVRDLASHRLIGTEEILAEGRLAVSDFESERWQSFRADARMILDGLGDGLETFLLDHGYNPTPVWTAIFGPLAQAVPAGSVTGLFLLTLIDPLLLLGCGALIAWARGPRDALIAGTYLLLVFGTLRFVGAAYGRYLWLFLLVAGFCRLAKQRHALAGALLAGAAALRIFPALFLAPLLLKIARRARRGRPIPARYRSLLAGAALAGLAAGSVSILLLGRDAWTAFFANMGTYLGVDPSNAIGFQTILETVAHLAGADPRSLPVRGLILATSAVLALLVALAASRRREAAALAAGAALCFLVFDLGGYYYAFLVLPLLAESTPRRAALALFALELLCHTLRLTLDPELHVLYLVRSLVIGGLLGSVWLDRVLREAALSTPRAAGIRP